MLFLKEYLSNWHKYNNEFQLSILI